MQTCASGGQMVSGTAVNRFLWWVCGLGGSWWGESGARRSLALLNHVGFQLRGMEAACGGAHPWAEGDPASPRHPGTGLKALAHRGRFSAPTAKGELM